MRFGNIEITRFKKSLEASVPPAVASPTGMSGEVSSAISPYFEPSQLRPYNPDELYQQKGDYSCFDRMREDDQISSLLTLKKIIVLNSEWTIESENDELVDFLTYCFNDGLDDIFEKKLFDILSAIDYGFSVTEKIVNCVDTPYGKKYLYTSLKTRAPHGFDLCSDDYGNLEYLLQHTQAQDIKLNTNKAILYSYQKEFDNFYGNSDLNKGVYRAFLRSELP